MKCLSLAVLILLLLFSPAQAQDEQSKKDAVAIFTRLLKSESEAEQLVNYLSTFTALSPWQFSTLTTLSQRLIVADFKSKEIMPTLMPCGDMAAALDFDDYGYAELVLRMARLRMDTERYAPYAHLSALERLGVPAYKILAEQIGKSTEEAQRMARRDEINGAGAFGALLDWYSQKYKGVAADVAKKRKG